VIPITPKDGCPRKKKTTTFFTKKAKKGLRGGLSGAMLQAGRVAETLTRIIEGKK